MKELRLEGISSIEAANAFMPRFINEYNNRFRKGASQQPQRAPSGQRR